MALGGAAQDIDVLAEIEQYVAFFTPLDLQPQKSHQNRRDSIHPELPEPRWQNRVRFERDALRKDGLLLPSSQPGLWELSHEGRAAARMNHRLVMRAYLQP